MQLVDEAAQRRRVGRVLLQRRLGVGEVGQARSTGEVQAGGTGHGNRDDDASWSVPSVKEKVVEYLDPKNSAGGQLTREEAFFTNQKLDRINSLPRGAATEIADVPDNAYADGRIAAQERAAV